MPRAWLVFLVCAAGCKGESGSAQAERSARGTPGARSAASQTGEPAAAQPGEPAAASPCVQRCIDSRQMQAVSAEKIAADCRAECEKQ
ncbi:MAG: hypothetical protein IPI67_16940 [Myxococcales bacterium]|nr:hypothetical protein [Myxococcales bacterium]